MVGVLGSEDSEKPMVALTVRGSASLVKPMNNKQPQQDIARNMRSPTPLNIHHHADLVPVITFSFILFTFM